MAKNPRWARIKLSTDHMLQKDFRKDKKRKLLIRLWDKHRVKPTPADSWDIVRDDLVQVLRGRDEGKQGRVLRVFRLGESCVVEGINLRVRKTKGSSGEILTEFKESKVLAKNLALVDPSTGVPTRVEWKFEQAAVDEERYQRVRMAATSTSIITKSEAIKPKRKMREVHPTKDTPTRLANIRTWIGPWEFFTDEQKEFIIEDCKDKIDLPNVQIKLPELFYNNVEEVQEYIRMLPYCPHTFFRPGHCAPFTYEKERVTRWSKRRMKKELKWDDGRKDLDKKELREQLESHNWSTFPIYLTNRIDPNHHWPRVRPEIDPKFTDFHKYLRTHSDVDDDRVMQLLDEHFGHGELEAGSGNEEEEDLEEEEEEEESEQQQEQSIAK